MLAELLLSITNTKCPTNKFSQNIELVLKISNAMLRFKCIEICILIKEIDTERLQQNATNPLIALR